MNSREQWVKDQERLERQEAINVRAALQRVKFANKPEQLSLDLPIPREYQIEVAYKELVQACQYGQISGWDGSDYQNTARKLLNE